MKRSLTPSLCTAVDREDRIQQIRVALITVLTMDLTMGLIITPDTTQDIILPTALIFIRHTRIHFNLKQMAYPTMIEA